jgi:hypothetical protein
MRVMASQAIGLIERLIVVRLFQIRARGIVTVETERRSRLGQVVIEFAFSNFACLVRNVASAATHIERSMATSALRDIDSDLVAGQTEILVFVFAFGRL